MLVGVLALQGDVREHIHAFSDLPVDVVPVRTYAEIEGVDALVIPGGESTTIAKLARSFGLFDLISTRIRAGMPTYGSCAGMILLADRVANLAQDQETFGGLDISVRRNAFGRQVDSFEEDLDVQGIIGGPMKGIFIRAPWVEEIGEQVEVLATVSISGVTHPVAVRSRHLLATSFHPEISGDNRIHKFFVEEVCRDLSRI
ncbi:MAG: pyridoxal 5'-phosphate synthase glutaminase subunit PdxT [Actinomycetes bacterium]